MYPGRRLLVKDWSSSTRSRIGRTSGIKTNIEVHQVIDPTYQTPKYTTYVINDTSNQLITPPPNHITNKHDSRVKPEITIKRTPGPISIKANNETYERRPNTYRNNTQTKTTATKHHNPPPETPVFKQSNYPVETHGHRDHKTTRDPANHTSTTKTMPSTQTKRGTEKEPINHESKSKIKELKHAITNTTPNTQNTKTHEKKTLNKPTKQTTRRGSVVWLACGPDP